MTYAKKLFLKTGGCVHYSQSNLGQFLRQSVQQHTHLSVDEDFLSADFCWDQDAISEKTKTVPQQLELDASNSDRQAT